MAEPSVDRREFFRHRADLCGYCGYAMVGAAGRGKQVSKRVAKYRRWLARGWITIGSRMGNGQLEDGQRSAPKARFRLRIKGAGRCVTWLSLSLILCVECPPLPLAHPRPLPQHRQRQGRWQGCVFTGSASTTRTKV